MRLDQHAELLVIAVYAPAASHDVEGLEDLLEDIHQLIAAPAPKNKKVYHLILGDLNSRVGRRQNDEPSLGQHGVGERNAKGAVLTTFCNGHGLIFTHSLFKKKPGRSWTWTGPNGTIKTWIDYIIVQKETRVTSTSVISNQCFDFETDHRLVRARLELPTNRRPRGRRHHDRRRIFDRPLYRYALGEQLRNFDENESAIVQLEQLRKAVRISREVASRDAEPAPRLSSKTIELLRRRRQLRLDETGLRRVELVTTSKALRASWQADIEDRRQRLLLHAVRTGSSLRQVRKTNAVARPALTQLRRADGSLTTTSEELQAVVRDFYNNLYTSRVHVPQPTTTQLAEDFPDILQQEVNAALAYTKGGTAPGPDGIPASDLRAGRDLLQKPLASLYNAILNEGVPETMADAKTILLFKKGDVTDIGNYRPISLISAFAKLFTKVLAARSESQLEQGTSSEQTGFRRSSSTVDAIFTVSELIARSHEYDFPLALAFVDFEKAFDSIELNAVYSAIQRMGVHPTIVSALQSLNATAISRVAVAETQVELSIQRGVRQGDSFSPRLFTAALEDALNRIPWNDRGVSINGSRLAYLAFADDVCLISHSTQELQSLLEDLDKACSQVGLKINTKKTVAMTNTVSPSILLQDQPVKFVGSFVYLGRLITFHKDRSGELQRRIGHAWASYNKYRAFFVSRRTAMYLKRRLFDTVVLPNFLYASETWAYTDPQLRALAVTQRRMERRMLGINILHRRTNEQLRTSTGVRDVLNEAERRKIEWAKKITKMSGDKWPRRISEWTPPFLRRPGRQRTRWRDLIKNRFGTRWLTTLG